MLNAFVALCLVEVAFRQRQSSGFDAVDHGELRNEPWRDAVVEELLNDRLAGLERLGAGVMRQPNGLDL